MEHKKHFSKLGFYLLLTTVIIYAVKYATVLITNKIPAITNDSSLSFLTSMLPMYVIAYPIIFLLFSRIPVQLSGEKKRMPASHIIVAFFIGYAATYILNLCTSLLTFFIGLLRQSPVNNVMLDITTSISPAVNLFIVVLCAPIMEELLFRKTLIDRTAHYGEGISLVFSGLVFGLFHGNLVQFSYAFVIGMFFGFIYIKTKDIKYSILLHMITNFLGSFVGSLVLDASKCWEFANELSELAAAGASEAEVMEVTMKYSGGLLLFIIYLLCLLAFVITGIILFCINIRKFKIAPGEIAIEKGKRFSTVILNAGMILYCIYWIAQIVLQLFE